MYVIVKPREILESIDVESKGTPNVDGINESHEPTATEIRGILTDSCPSNECRALVTGAHWSLHRRYIPQPQPIQNPTLTPTNAPTQQYDEGEAYESFLNEI